MLSCRHFTYICFSHYRNYFSDYPNPEDFNWDDYLKETNSLPAPVRAFKQKAASGFKKGMKLECVDKRIPQLIRVATVQDVKGHQIRIQFDGWQDKYSYWMEDDSPDIHPATWCQKTGHPLEPPLSKFWFMCYFTYGKNCQCRCFLLQDE